MDLLFRHNVHVICLGDPFQLPPVDKDSDNHLLDHPHIFLDEIMRQSAESEIIQLATKIRNFEPFGASMFAQKEVMILPQKELNTGILMWGDQVLVATNATRVNFNQSMRNQLGHQGMPEDGDKVICLRNYWDDIGSNEEALTNGTIGYLKNPYASVRYAPRVVKGLERREYPIIGADIVVDNEGSFFAALEIDKEMLLTGEKCMGWRDAYILNKYKMRYGEIVPKEFAYGYAITRHKAQGSEWEKVLVLEEHFPVDPIEHARWLYTAATRASKKLVIVR
jgi:exodeoxyribonuclease-5